MGYKLIVTHGNGPQAGNLLIQQEEGNKLVPAMPMYIVGAMTQGQIGYMFQNTLQNYFMQKGKNIPIATVVTQVLVKKMIRILMIPANLLVHFIQRKKLSFLRKKRVMLLSR